MYSEASSKTVLRIENQACIIEGVKPEDQQILTDFCAQGLPTLCWIMNFYPKKKPTVCLIQVHQFASLFRLPLKMEIGIDEQIVEQAQQKNPQIKHINDVIKWLNHQLLLSSSKKSENSRGFISAGKGKTKEDQKAFRMHGLSIAADVRIEDEILKMQRIVSVRTSQNNDNIDTIMLTEAPINFCDVTVAGKFRGEARRQLDDIVARGESYLDIWSKYNELERNSFLERRPIFWVFPI